MAVWNITWFFEASQTQTAGDVGPSALLGWSESWYREYPDNMDIETILGLNKTKTDVPGNYLFRRLPLLPKLYGTNFCRVSRVQPNGIGVGLTKVANVNYLGQLDIAPNATAQTTCAVLVDMTAVVPEAPPLIPHSHRRQMFVRGLPIECISGNLFKPVGAYRNAFFRFLNMFVERGSTYRIRYRNTVASAWASLTGVAVQNNKRTLGVLPVPAGILRGQRVFIRRVKEPRALNKTYKALDVPTVAGNPLIIGFTKDNFVGNWDGTGEIRADVMAFAVPTNYLVMGLRSRKIGRPTRPFRGRRRVA